MMNKNGLVTVLLSFVVCVGACEAEPVDVDPNAEDTGESLQDSGEAAEDTGESPQDSEEAAEDTGESLQDSGEAAEDTGESPQDSEEAAEDTDESSPACVDRQPSGATEATLCEVEWSGYITSTDCSQYASVFGGDFPGQTGQGINFGQQRDTYFAMEFSTTNLTRSRGWWTVETAQLAPTTSGPRIMTISRCPGDFDRAAIEAEMGPDCYVKTSGFTSSVSWKRAGTSGSHCVLDLDQTYYLNMIYTNDPSGTPPEQLKWACGSHESTPGCGNIMAPVASR